MLFLVVIKINILLCINLLAALVAIMWVERWGINFVKGINDKNQLQQKLRLIKGRGEFHVVRQWSGQLYFLPKLKIACALEDVIS